MIHPQPCPQALWRTGPGESGSSCMPTRSSTCICTPSTRCSTVRRGSATSSPRSRRRRAARGRHHRPREHVRRPPDVHRRARCRHQAGARHGGVLHQHVALRPPEALRARDLPPHAARGDERGLPQPHQGHEQRVPRRLLLQAAQRLGAARAPPRGHHRDDAAASAASSRS